MKSSSITAVFALLGCAGAMQLGAWSNSTSSKALLATRRSASQASSTTLVYEQPAGDIVTLSRNTVDMPGTDSITGNDARTVVGFFKTGQTDSYNIFECGTPSSSCGMSFAMGRWFGEHGTSSQGMTCHTWCGCYSNSVGKSSQSVSIDSGTWYHFAHVYDGTTHYLYFDGALFSSGTDNNNPLITAATGCVFGSKDTRFSFDGQVKSVKVYSGAMSASEVASSASGSAQTPSPTPLPTAAAPAGYSIAYSDTWCGDASLYDATAGSSDAMVHTTVDSCAQKCNDDSACQFFVWGWNPSGYYRCATFTTCNDRHDYIDGDPNVYQKASIGGMGGGATAVGDPHLQNVHGERFDLMKEGKHVLISIPRGMSAANALLYVQADARRLGGKCADMYFQELNMTGAWAEAKQAGGYHYSISQHVVNTPEWLAFGKVELKVVHGRTISGLRYLNVYVKHLGQAGYAVGGLLGEDDHSDVAQPPVSCRRKMSLLGLVA